MVYFHVEDLSKKPYSIYLAIWGRLLILDRSFMKSVFGPAGIAVTHVNAAACRAVTSREIHLATGGNIACFTTLPGLRAMKIGP